MTTNIILAILVTSLATFSSRFLGVITSEKIKENSKIFRWSRFTRKLSSKFKLIICKFHTS